MYVQAAINGSSKIVRMCRLGLAAQGCVNPLLHRPFLDHGIIFYFYTTLKKNQEKFKLSFEYF